MLKRADDYAKFRGLRTQYGTESAERRRLRIFALDPLTRTASNPGALAVTIDVPNEDLTPGPSGKRVRVIDYDGSLDVYYAPVDLDEAPLLMQDGLGPTESDPRFHQQMVYAVTMRVLENFERALGRKLGFHGRKLLEVYPHAFRGANAFFEPEANAVLFGYFSADEANPGENLPGQTVFACLSHDIVAHEVTHAMLYRLRPYFVEPTNMDVLAFHEAISDIVAIFQHFTFPDVLRSEIQEHHGTLRAHGVLLDLAKQFGHGTGKSDALRSAFEGDAPQPTDYLSVTEPHDRGSLLVSAVFDAFFVGYQRRTHPAVKLATGGSGQLPDGDLSSDLVAILATEAASAAQSVLLMCIRALEYLPPVDVTFGDFLRAIVTSDRDLDREDRWGMRAAMIEAFRLRGIYPKGVRSLAEDSLLWQDEGLPPLGDQSVIASLFVEMIIEDDDPDDAVERFGTAAASPTEPTGSEAMQSEQLQAPEPRPLDHAAARLHEYGVANAAALGLDPALPIRLTGFHRTSRIAASGRIRTDIVVQFVQERQPAEADAARYGGLPLRAGTTVIFKQNGEVRYTIRKPLYPVPPPDAVAGARSLAMIESHIAALDDQDLDAVWRDQAYLASRMVERANFAMLDRRPRSR